jgi:hypothetical protein
MTATASAHARCFRGPPSAITDVIEWDDCLATAAADIWGEQNIALAVLDIAGVAFLPALTIIEDAAWTLAQRCGWDGHELGEAFFIGLRACHLTHRRPGHVDQPSDLAEWFLRDLEAAHWSLLPEVDCRVCGATHKNPCAPPRPTPRAAKPTAAESGQLSLDVPAP